MLLHATSIYGVLALARIWTPLPVRTAIITATRPTPLRASTAASPQAIARTHEWADEWATDRRMRARGHRPSILDVHTVMRGVHHAKLGESRVHRSAVGRAQRRPRPAHSIVACRRTHRGLTEHARRPSSHAEAATAQCRVDPPRCAAPSKRNSLGRSRRRANLQTE